MWSARLTTVEIGLESVKMDHGRRLRELETEREARNEAIVKGLRGLVVLLAGIVIDMRLNGGAVLKLLFGGLH